MLVPQLYDAVWRRFRELKPFYRALSDEFLWYTIYESYVDGIACNGKLYAPVQGELCRDALIEFHLGIVGPIAGQIARKRFPATFGAVPNSHAKDGHDDLVHELIALGNLGLFEAFDHFKPEAGRFSTIANPYIRKFIYRGSYRRPPD